MKRKWRMALGLLLSALLASSAALARIEVHQGANVRFEVPDNWLMRTEGPVMVIAPPGGGVGMEFVALTDPAHIRQSEVAIVQMMSSRFTNISVAARGPVSQNGLAGSYSRGLAQRGGQMLEWFAVSLGQGNRGILAVGFASQGGLEANLGTIRHILNSIQPNS